MRHLGVASNSPPEISNMFAVFFKNIYKKTGNATGCMSEDVGFTNTCMLRFTGDAVLRGLLNLEVDKGSGPDEIPNSFLKQFAEDLLFPITEIFNLSLSSGHFPTFWKISHVIPIYKDGDRCEISNYRGICIISAIPKLFEKLVYDRISLDIFPYIADEQHGFTPGRSIVTNLANFISPTIQWIEDGSQVDVVYTDFSKAFDRVNLALLILKLREFGFDGSILKWMESYLVGRQQFVRFLGHCSSLFETRSGVPQGSHLGPLFFILFINGVVMHVPSVSMLIYADDVKLFLRINSLNDCYVLQNALDSFVGWCNKMDLDLNVKKCKVMSFTRKRNVIKYDYHINQQTVPKCDVVSDLGVVLDNKLTMNLHIDHIVKKSMKMLGFIKRFSREFNDVFIAKTLFVSLVRPILEFASVIWSPCFVTHIARVEAVQRNFSRFALRFLVWRDPLNLPTYENRLRLLNLDTLFLRRKLFDGLFIHDILSSKIQCPRLIAALSFNAGKFNLRHRSLFYVSKHRTCYGLNNPMDRALSLFNDICDDYDCNESRNLIKCKFRRCLLNE